MSFALNGTNQYLSTTSLPALNFPCTLAGWFYITSLASQRTLIQIGTTGNHWRVSAATSGAVKVGTFNGSSFPESTTSTGLVSTNTWFFAGGRFTSTASREAFCGTSFGAANTTSQGAYSNTNNGWIGADLGGGEFLAGRGAHWGIWTVALTDAEIIGLARGYPPRSVRPAALASEVFAVRNLVDTRGTAWTNNNAATVAEHAPIIMPRRRVAGTFAGTSPPPPPPSNTNYLMPLLGVGDD